MSEKCCGTCQFFELFSPYLGSCSADGSIAFQKEKSRGYVYVSEGTNCPCHTASKEALEIHERRSRLTAERDAALAEVERLKAAMKEAVDLLKKWRITNDKWEEVEHGLAAMELLESTLDQLRGEKDA